MYNYAKPQKNSCVVSFVTPSPLPLQDLVKRLELFKDRRLKITIIVIIISIIAHLL